MPAAKVAPVGSLNGLFWLIAAIIRTRASLVCGCLHMPVLCLSRCEPTGEVWALYEAPPGLRAHGL